jgi:hypothetical protein
LCVAADSSVPPPPLSDGSLGGSARKGSAPNFFRCFFAAGFPLLTFARRAVESAADIIMVK